MINVFRILTILLLTCNIAFAQITQTQVTADILANLPTNNQNQISAVLLQNTLNYMTSAIFQSQGLNGISIIGTPSAGQFIIATGPTTASWQTTTPASNIIAGTTLITGTCTNAFVLYNNNGVLGCENSTGTGNVSNFGMPVANQIAQWVDSTHIQGLNTTGNGNIVLSTSPTITGLTVTGSFLATGLITNNDLVNSSVIVNSQACALGSNCTVSTAAGMLTGASLASNVLASSLTSVGTLSTLTVAGNLTTGITGSTQCLQVNTLGLVSGTGTACGSGGGGGVSTVANSDGTLTISPNTGNVIASLALGHVNTWTAAQAFSGSASVAGLTVTSSFTATGLVGNAALVNSSTTVNSQTCTLGSTCTVAAAAGTLTGSTLASGVTGSSLTSVGTIASGTWQGSVIAGLYGGTGLSAAAVGDLIVATSPTPTWGRLADVATGSLLASGGTNTSPAYCVSCTLTSSNTGATNQFTIANSGTLSTSGTASEITVSLGGTASINMFALGGSQPFGGIAVGAGLSLGFSFTTNAGAITFNPFSTLQFQVNNSPVGDYGNTTAGAWSFPAPVRMVPVAIGSLPACNSGLSGARYTVNNAQTTPTFLGAVSSTGAVTAPVFCNGSGWVYG